MRILICEDDPIIGADQCKTICGGEDKPDCVIVDLNLADGPTGLDLVDWLALIGIPTIIVSGSIRQIDRPHRAIATLNKPVVPNELCQALHACCR